MVAAELAGVARVVEEGLGARTTVWESPFAPGRDGRAYLVPCLASHAPVDVLVVMLGTNDLKSVYRLTAADVAAGAASLVDVALASRAGPDGGPPRVLLVSPPRLGAATAIAAVRGFGEAQETSAHLAQHYRTAAAELGCAFLDADAVVAVHPADGVHLDAAGHAALGRAIAAEVRVLLAPDRA